jgi:hypothetical protein
MVGVAHHLEPQDTRKGVHDSSPSLSKLGQDGGLNVGHDHCLTFVKGADGYTHKWLLTLDPASESMIGDVLPVIPNVYVCTRLWIYDLFSQFFVQNA